MGVATVANTYSQRLIPAAAPMAHCSAPLQKLFAAAEVQVLDMLVTKQNHGNIRGIT
jgi:hypothetical protein